MATFGQRAAMRRVMTPSLAPNTGVAQPQGFYQNNRRAINTGINLANQVLGTAGDVATQYYNPNNYQQANAIPPITSEEFKNNVLENIKNADFLKNFKNSIEKLQSERNQERAPVDEQLRETLKNLIGDRVDRMAERGESNPEKLERQAFNTANSQRGNQPPPIYESGRQFPWETLLGSATHRYGLLNREDTGVPGNVNPNELQERLAGLAPNAGRAVGRIGGGLLGGFIGGATMGPAGIPIGAGLGSQAFGGLGEAGGEAIKSYTTANPITYRRTT